MNKPNKLLKEISEFNESLYGYELSAKKCKTLSAYIESLEKALDKSCKFIEDHYCNCPYDVENFCKHMEECDDNYAKCWKEYFLRDE